MGKRLFQIGLIGAWLGMNCTLLSAQISANANFSPPETETGDTFSLRILVSGASGTPRDVDFKPWAAIIQANDILSHSGWRRSGTQWVQQFTLICFDSIDTELPPLPIHLAAGTVETNPVQLKVKPTPAEADVSTLADVRGIVREPLDWTDFWPVYAGLLVLLLVLWRFLPKRKKMTAPVQAPVVHAEPPVPAHEIALQALKNLEAQKSWEKGETKAFYAELSMILRQYLEVQYRVAALESTTNELQLLLKQANFPKELIQQIQKVLMQSDLVKYAKHLPKADQALAALRETRHIVEYTLNASTKTAAS